MRTPPGWERSPRSAYANRKLSVPFTLNYASKLRQLTAPIRLLPDFLIVGAQKCGTTSLYRYLIQHPCVEPIVPIGHQRKEVRYFSKYHHHGLAWYKAHFPTRLYKLYVRVFQKRRLMIGESTPSYMFHPLAPRRIFELLPGIKLIALLRNPVDRAYSHYQHVRRIGKESLTFEDAMDREAQRIRKEREKILADAHYLSFGYGYHSYLTRGIYADQIKPLFEIFPREHILILNAERFFEEPGVVFRDVLSFLRLPQWEPEHYKEHNAGRYGDMSSPTRQRLVDFYRPHNRRLFELIGEEFDWA